MKNPAAQQLGKLGGSVKSDAKTTAARENGKKGGRPRMNFYWDQLAGALGMLKSNGVDLPWSELNMKLRQIAAEHGPNCDTDEVKLMYRQYRDMCLDLGLIRQGENFDWRDAVPLV